MTLQEVMDNFKTIRKYKGLQYYNLYFKENERSVSFMCQNEILKSDGFQNLINTYKNVISRIDLSAINELKTIKNNTPKNISIEMSTKELYSVIFIAVYNYFRGSSIYINFPIMEKTMEKDEIKKIINTRFSKFYDYIRKDISSMDDFRKLLQVDKDVFLLQPDTDFVSFVVPDTKYNFFINYLKLNANDYFDLEFITDLVFNNIDFFTTFYASSPANRSLLNITEHDCTNPPMDLEYYMRNGLNYYANNFLSSAKDIYTSFKSNILNIVLYDAITINEIFNFYRTIYTLEQGIEATNATEAMIKDYINKEIFEKFMSENKKEFSSLLNSFISSSFKTSAWDNYANFRSSFTSFTLEHPWGFVGKINGVMTKSDIILKLFLYLMNFIKNEVMNDVDVIKKYGITKNNLTKILTSSI